MNEVSPAWYVTSTFERLTEHGDSVALLHNGESTSYRELLTQTYRVAHVLRAAGLGRGAGIVVVADNRPSAVAIRLAAYLLGLRVTPFATGTIAGTPAWRHILSDVDASALVYEPVAALAELPELATEAGVRTILRIGGSGTVPDLIMATATQPDTPLGALAVEDEVCRVYYTSGTTGAPKGVPTTYRGLGVATKVWESSGSLPPGMRLVLASPFSVGSGDLALNVLRAGGSVELLDGFDPAEFVAATARAELVMTYLYPSWLYRLLDHLDTADADLGALKFLIYGSAPILPERLRQAIGRFGPIMLQTYASTEAPAIAGLGPEEHATAFSARPELLASAGRPLPGIEVTVLRPDGSAAPVGEIGEVCLRGASIMPGYWRRPELTAAAILDGVLHTGDLGRFDADGYLYLVGRFRDMIIVDGRNYYAGPIEDRIAAHPAVLDAAVVGSPDQRTGEAINAFVVLRGGAQVSTADLRSWVETGLDDRPVLATVTVLPELPMAASGKVDKVAMTRYLPQPV